MGVELGVESGWTLRWRLRQRRVEKRQNSISFSWREKNERFPAGDGRWPRVGRGNGRIIAPVGHHERLQLAPRKRTRGPAPETDQD